MNGRVNTGEMNAGKVYEAPLDTLRRQAVEDRPAFMAALKAAGMSKVGERLAFEQQLLAQTAAAAPATLPAAASASGLPDGFIHSAFPTKREYEQSLLLPAEERVFAENAARRKVNAGVAVGALERFHGLIHAAVPVEDVPIRSDCSGEDAESKLSTFAFHALNASQVDQR